MRKWLVTLVIPLPLAVFPASAETAYLDDRSDAAALVRSLYNAVNRKEYGRAWDYFGDTKPSKDFAAFAKGYEATGRVDVATGAVASEGAAGSTIYHVPVAISSVGTDGTERTFAGCYTARLANPQIQETPFRPLHLLKGSLQPAEGSPRDAVPASCPDAPAPDPLATLNSRATAMFVAAHGDECEAPDEADEQRRPADFTISYHLKSDGEDQAAREARLFRFFCSMGAYNETHIYYLHDDMNGLQEVQFATPEMDIRYEDEDPEGKLRSMTLIGYRADARMVNSDYDEATLTILSHSKWRGVGDASSTGTWIFRDGAFTLVRYEVDPTYDGEINPETVVDYETAP